MSCNLVHVFANVSFRFSCPDFAFYYCFFHGSFRLHHGSDIPDDEFNPAANLFIFFKGNFSKHSTMFIIQIKFGFVFARIYLNYFLNLLYLKPQKHLPIHMEIILYNPAC